MAQTRLKKFEDIIVLVVVVSFVVSTASGFLAGALAYRFFGNEDGLEEAQSSSRIIVQEQAIVETVKKVSPAVVSVVGSKDLPILERYYLGPFGDDFFRRFFGEDFNFQMPQYRQDKTERTEVSGGTGFIVSSDGLILTNKHVVSDEEADYMVLTNEGEKVPAEVLAIDPVNDIAVLKIDRSNLPVVELGDSDSVQIGQTVIAIGNALGEYRNTVSVGVVSGLKRSITAGDGLGGAEQLSEVIQTDAAINPGNSGGPLLDLNGRVIGINVAMAQGAQNIAFALPINKADRDLKQIEKEGRIVYPFLGVRYVLITPSIKEENELAVDYGALVTRGVDQSEPAIIPDSPADKADMREGDIILEFDGEKITVDNSLAGLIQEHEIGETVILKVLRQGKEKTIKLTLGERE